MSGLVIVGAQWGDEGKGKIVDWLCEEADAVVRFQGGMNAGHTLVIDGEIYKLNMLPSGVIRPGKISIIGSGAVIEAKALMSEIEGLRLRNIEISPNNLLIAENSNLILPIHKKIDNLNEKLRGKERIGTTGLGIGPAYEDKIGRRGIRLCDLNYWENIEMKAELMLNYHNPLLKSLGEKEMGKDELLEELKIYKTELLKYAKPTWKNIKQLHKQGKRILFEGAQGIMLDVDHGTYPYVTSSNTIAGYASVGSGCDKEYTGSILGLAKAYSTRVGGGPFPTELHNEDGIKLAKIGNEIGTVTGRPRRCGWFDAVAVRQAVAISGIKHIALTKLDVLDRFAKLKLCIGYKYKDEDYDYLPAANYLQENIEPIYEEISGWQSETSGVTDFEKLPIEAKNYVQRIEELIECKIIVISTGAKREDTILLQNPFE